MIMLLTSAYIQYNQSSIITRDIVDNITRMMLSKLIVNEITSRKNSSDKNVLKRFISQTDGGMPSYRCHRLHVTVVASFSRRESYSISACSSRDLLKQQFLQPKSLVSEKWALECCGEDEEMQEISRFPLVNRRKYYLRIVIISK